MGILQNQIIIYIKIIINIRAKIHLNSLICFKIIQSGSMTITLQKPL